MNKQYQSFVNQTKHKIVTDIIQHYQPHYLISIKIFEDF